MNRLDIPGAAGAADRGDVAPAAGSRLPCAPAAPAFKAPFVAAPAVAARAAALGCALAILAPHAGAASGTVVRHFASGTSQDSVGIVAPGEDAQEDGPQAIYAADDGSLYLLDQVNGRILRFDAKSEGSPVQSIALPDAVQPTDLVVGRGTIYVWDGGPRALAPAGGEDGPKVRGLNMTRSAAAPDAAVLSAFAQMGSLAQSAADDPPYGQNGGPDGGQAGGHGQDGGQTRAVHIARRAASQIIATRGRGSVAADVVTSDRRDSADVEVFEQDSHAPVARLHLKVRDRIGAVEFLEIDNDGRMFVLTENIPAGARRPAGVFVARFSRAGALESIYDIPLQEDVAISRRFIAVTPDGDVYFLRSRRSEVDVVGVGSRRVSPAAVIENPGLPHFSERETRIVRGPIAAVRPLTRQQVVQAAIAFESLQWRPTAANYGADPDTLCTGFNRIRRPGYLSGKLEQEVRGVPYCWGCMTALSEFRARIAGGMLAGNMCTHNEPRTDVAGVDCSSFVSAAWGLSNHFTTAAMPAITTELADPLDLQPGDALNKPGSHVMLFLGFTADRKARVMESSPSGCNGRVCRNVYPLASLLARGFRPVRFNALHEDQPVAVASAGPADGGRSEPPAPSPTHRGHGRRTRR